MNDEITLRLVKISEVERFKSVVDIICGTHKSATNAGLIPQEAGYDIIFAFEVGFGSSADESTTVSICLNDASGEGDAWDTSVSTDNADCLSLKQQVALTAFAVEQFETNFVPLLPGHVVGY